jgi:U32 family peptidase
VLARECSLKMMKEIREKADIESGSICPWCYVYCCKRQVFYESSSFGKSANRGECVQPCRREYAVYDEIIDKSMVIGEDYVLSPEDLCSIEFIDKLIESGIDSFKIEGRKRSPEYVAKTVSVYRKAIDLYFENKLTDSLKKEFLEDLRTVYNRGFSSGFYFNIPSSEEYADIYGSKATTRKEYAGKVLNYYKKPKIAYVLIEAGPFRMNDKIIIIGPTTGVAELTVQDLRIEESSSDTAAKGDKVTFPSDKLVRPGDAVYLIKEVVPEY